MLDAIYNNEYFILKYIAVNNSFSSKITDSIINKHKNKKATVLNNINFGSIECGNNLHFTLNNELKITIPFWRVKH